MRAASATAERVEVQEKVLHVGRVSELLAFRVSRSLCSNAPGENIALAKQACVTGAAVDPQEAQA